MCTSPDTLIICDAVQLSNGGNPDISTAPLPMWYASMGYTPMIYTSTALYFYTERTQVPSQFFT